jgi:DNA (cytosine-5)-methyltransferase 1
MLAYLYRQLGEHRGAPRFWLEGTQPARAGFEPGVRYAVSVHKDIKTVTLSVMDAGQRIVSKKQKSGKEIPVIDINNREILEIFEGIEVLRVVVRKRRIHLLPAVTEIRRRERLDRLTRKMAANEPITIGAFCDGIGVMSHAIHSGLSEKGVHTKLAFVNEIREEFLDQSFVHNSIWDAESVFLAAPMQDLAMDTWAVQQLGQCDLLHAGLPCSGASVAGRAKLGTSCAEAHEHVGALVQPFIQLIGALSPVAVVLENVPAYQSSASMWILRHSLRDLGYDVHETIMDAGEFNELEHRKRLCMVAVTKGMQFDFSELEKPEPSVRKLAEVLDDVAEDDPCWSGFDYLKRHQERHAEKGNGFRMQVFSPEDDHISTITKGYGKIRSTDPKIAHPTNPDLMRQLTPVEHARCKGIPDSLIEGMTKTVSHEGLGQSICYGPFKALGRLLADALRKPIDMAIKTAMPDLLAAA